MAGNNIARDYSENPLAGTHGEPQKKPAIATQSEDPIGNHSVEGHNLNHFVCFLVDGQPYALPLGDVERALRMVALVPVPEAPPWIAGAINLHNKVILVFDLRKRFNHPSREPQPDDRLLIIKTPIGTMALIVDEVTGVMEVPAHHVERAPDPPSEYRCLAGVLRGNEELVMVLDTARLVLPAGAEQQKTRNQNPVQEQEHEPSGKEIPTELSRL